MGRFFDQFSSEHFVSAQELPLKQKLKGKADSFQRAKKNVCVFLQNFPLTSHSESTDFNNHMALLCMVI